MRFANSQARARARLGALPGAAQWRHIAQAADLDNLLERMRLSGLGFWVNDLPRDPGPRVIQVHLYARARRFVERFCALLPAEWETASRWLRLLPDYSAAALLLRAPSPDPALDADSPLGVVLETPLEERAARLRQAGHDLLADTATMDENWLDGFLAALPVLHGYERRTLARLRGIVTDHQQQIVSLRETFRRAEVDGGVVAPGPHAQWRARDALMEALRNWLGATDPFHGAFLLGYALIEALQYERLRAMLLAYARHWELESRTWEAR
jgi:hypothetical protein